jgi:hypothetical protein
LGTVGLGKGAGDEHEQGRQRKSAFREHRQEGYG